MSGSMTKARRAPTANLQIPRGTDPITAAQVNAAYSVIEQYEWTRASRMAQVIPTHPALHLTSPDGTTWMLTVGDDGSITTAAVPRS